MTKTMYAGMELDAHCGRCKMETKHRILSITDGVPEKLICVNCNAVHKYRPERVIAERPPSSNSNSRAPSQARAAKSPRQSSEPLAKRQFCKSPEALERLRIRIRS
jgi:hypothetical protein